MHYPCVTYLLFAAKLCPFSWVKFEWERKKVEAQKLFSVGMGYPGISPGWVVGLYVDFLFQAADFGGSHF